MLYAYLCFSMHNYSFENNSKKASNDSSLNSNKSKSNSTGSATSRLRVGLIGARGYSGMELGRSLLQHPYVESLTLGTNETAIHLKHWLPESLGREVQCLPVNALIESASQFDIVFLATPAEASMELAPGLLKSSTKVIDLSGAFRLSTTEKYQTWYGLKHTSPELLGLAQYGLSPFLSTASDSNSTSPHSEIRLIANPGCYATAVQMALIPLLKKNLLQTESIVIDAKSGTTGAGKKAAESQLFAEISEDSFPYKIGKHQHYPEFCDHISLLTQTKINPHFSTSLLPLRRGITAGIYAHLQPGCQLSDVTQAFQEAFAQYPLARFTPLNDPSNSASEDHSILSLKKVVGSARTHISYGVIDNKLYLYSCIDNLMKGAASQAIENMNYLWGWPVHTGLLHREGLI